MNGKTSDGSIVIPAKAGIQKKFPFAFPFALSGAKRQSKGVRRAQWRITVRAEF